MKENELPILLSVWSPSRNNRNWYAVMHTIYVKITRTSRTNEIKSGFKIWNDVKLAGITARHQPFLSLARTIDNTSKNRSKRMRRDDQNTDGVTFLAFSSVSARFSHEISTFSAAECVDATARRPSRQYAPNLASGFVVSAVSVVYSVFFAIFVWIPPPNMQVMCQKWILDVELLSSRRFVAKNRRFRGQKRKYKFALPQSSEC